MSSFRFSLWMLTACGLLSGCVVTPDGKVALKVFYKDPAQTEKLADQEKAGDRKEDKASAVAAKEKADNPFRKKEGDAGKAAVAETSAKKPASDAQIATASAESAKTAEIPGKDSSAKNGVLSVDTLKLIDEELADATPEERADWYEQLKRVDPAVIPQILQARKMSLQVASMRQADTASDREFDEADAARDSSIAKPTEPRSQRSHNARKTASFDRSGEIEPTGYQEYGNDRHEADHRDSAVAQASESAPARNRWLSPGKQPPAGRNDNGQYVVQRVSGETQSPESAVGTAGGVAATTPRQGLARFLPRSVSSNSAQLTANSPSAVSLMPPTDIHPASSQDGLDQLISEIEADIVNWQPGATEEEQVLYIQRHVYLRLLYLMANHPERALTAIPGVDPADQEFWQQMLWSMTNYFDTQHIPAAKDRASQAVAQLETASLRLREQASLELRNMAFCRQIELFGNFERFPRDEFHPGQEVRLYAEIENFKSELTVDGQYRTLLKSTIEILSPSGEVRWQKDFPGTEDLCNNHRQDYFHNYEFLIPERLPLGPHRLKLTVIDELSGKVASQSINFMVR